MRLALPFVHRWVAMKWGHGLGLDCRVCRWCGRFEVYSYGSFHKVDRAPTTARAALADPKGATE